MTPEVKDGIYGNIDFLSANTNNFSELLEKLKQYRILTPKLVKIIERNPNEQDKIKNFYHVICKRGPDAFYTLLLCLSETKNEAAHKVLKKLQPTKFLDRNSVMKAKHRVDFDTGKHYRMGSRPKGIALIININKFEHDEHEERIGSLVDSKQLIELWEGLGYKTEFKSDLKRDELLKTVTEFSQNPGLKSVDSCVVFIMSHGELNSKHQGVYLITHDNLKVHSHSDIVAKFSAEVCKNLVGKPKMFFFQACRGQKKEMGLMIPTDSIVSSEPNEDYLNGRFERDLLPNGENLNGLNQSNSPNGENANGLSASNNNELIDVYNSDKCILKWNKNVHPVVPADCLIVYPTYPGFVSLRDNDLGSWFVQDICSIFAHFAFKEPLLLLLNRVMQKENRLHPSFGTQLVNYENFNFKKILYFNPGIYY